MIKVKVLQSKFGIKELSVSGHAESAEYGKDLVCAGVSCIVIGTANALDQLSNDKTEISVKRTAKFKVLKPDENNQIILKTCLIQLQTVQEQYQDYIDIQITEV